MGLLDFFAETIGIDPGSDTLRLMNRDKIIFNERTQISFDTASNKVSGFGDKVSGAANDVTIKPVYYVIADFHGFEMLLRAATKKGLQSDSFIQKSLIAFWCIPTNATEIEKRAYRDCAEHANAKQVYMIHQSVCSAVGMGVLFEKKNFVVIDFSSSKLETTIFSDCKPVSVGVFRLGTWQIFRLIRNHILRKHRIRVSDDEIGMLLADMNNPSVRGEVKVQYTIVTTREIDELLANFFYLVNDDILETFERVSNDRNMSQVLSNGVYFTGGGSTIEYLRKQIKLDRRIKISMSPTPLLDNIRGLGVIMKDKQRFEKYIMT